MKPETADHLAKARECLGAAIGANEFLFKSMIEPSVNMPIVHKLFSNVKVWLNGTYHGVSTKHLPRYLREWSYRFNRRGRIDELDHFLLRRAVGRPTITYAVLIAGVKIEGAS